MKISYEIWLVVLSIAVAVFASYVALYLTARVAASSARRACFWWLGGAFSLGVGIWSMHFIGMLALSLPIPVSFDASITAVSLLAGVLVCGFALKIASDATLTLHRTIWVGSLMGLGISAMHYIGMEAMQMRPALRYDPLLYSGSILIAVLASMAALNIAFQLRSTSIFSSLKRKFGGALLMGGAISGMHYVGMSAVLIDPGSVCTVPPQDINNAWLGGAIGIFAFGLMSTVLLMSAFDAHLAAHSEAYSKTVEDVNARLQAKAAELISGNAALEREVNNRKQAEAQAQYLAYHDALTTLPNRRSFYAHLEQAISRARRSGKLVAVVFIDLDKFKDVNDTFGHSAGDMLLKSVGERIKGSLRESDIVGRIGGDEFAVLLDELDDPLFATTVANKILAGGDDPILIDGQPMGVTSSIGLSIYPYDGADEHELMRNADTAMYVAKAHGKNEFRYFSNLERYELARAPSIEKAE